MISFQHFTIFSYFLADIFNVSTNGEQREFYLASWIDSFSNYWLNDEPLETYSNVLDIADIPEDNAYCLFVIYNSTLEKLKISGNDCSEEKMVICRKASILTPNCSANSSFQKQSTFDFMLNPAFQLDRDRAIDIQKLDYKRMMSALNQTLAFESIFSTLWYSKLPCLDIKGLSADRSGVNFTNIL
jgi:hypothetical protein